MFERVCVSVEACKNPYRSLIDQVLDDSAFPVYLKWETKYVTVQGASHVPAGLRTIFLKNGVHFTLIGYGESEFEDIQNADLLICHAGDLIVLSALNRGKPVVMVKNDKLVDTRHVELCEELAKEKYCAMVSMKDCLSKIANFDAKSIIPFPPPPMRRESFSEDLWALLNKSKELCKYIEINKR